MLKAGQRVIFLRFGDVLRGLIYDSPDDARYAGVLRNVPQDSMDIVRAYLEEEALKDGLLPLEVPHTSSPCAFDLVAKT